jgi:hypothetical protein
MKPYEFLRFLRFLLFQNETDPMHLRFAKSDRTCAGGICTAIEMHRTMWPVLLESIYDRRLIKPVDGISKLVPPAANKT